VSYLGKPINGRPVLIAPAGLNAVINSGSDICKSCAANNLSLTGEKTGHAFEGSFSVSEVVLFLPGAYLVTSKLSASRFGTRFAQQNAPAGTSTAERQR
jgi:hypothetical protein